MREKNPILVKEIKWFSKEAQEADVLISDGNFQCWASSLPCNLKVNDKLESNLVALMAEHIVIANETNPTLTNLNGLETHGIGKLINKAESIIQIGGFHIEIDGYLPGDCSIGDMISFDCIQIDVTD